MTAPFDLPGFLLFFGIPASVLVIDSIALFCGLISDLGGKYDKFIKCAIKACLVGLMLTGVLGATYHLVVIVLKFCMPAKHLITAAWFGVVPAINLWTAKTSWRFMKENRLMGAFLLENGALFFLAYYSAISWALGDFMQCDF